MPRRVEKIHNEKRLKAVRRDLRNNAMPAEARLWECLKQRRLQGRKFRRQHSIGAYVVDFYCPAEKLVVELDGAPHQDALRRVYDAERASYLVEQGLQIVRFDNRTVFEDLDTVLEGIAWHFKG